MSSMNISNEPAGRRRIAAHAGTVVVALVQMTGQAAKRPQRGQGRCADRRSGRRRGQIVCLQELFAGQYPCQSEDHAPFDQAEPIPGPTSDALADAARRHGVVIVGSLFERRAAGPVSQHGRGV